jgi:uncharacterized protein (TIGR02444 family)
MIMPKILPSHPFWIFSTKIYRHSTVEKNLIELQNERGLNVNVLLYCCWHSLTDQGVISRSDLRQILINIQPWHERIVLPLRRMRQKLKSAQKKSLLDIRQDVLKHELAAEQIEQLIMLENFVYKARPICNNFQKIIDICKNIAVYCHLLHAFLDLKDCEKISKIVGIIFPKIDQGLILRYCMEHLIEKEVQSMNLTAQFPLDL